MCQNIDEISRDPAYAHRKSLALATVLGLIPGGGQVYAGRWGSGVASLVLNSALFALSAYAAQRGENATALFTGALSVGLYAGNIYAGYESARRFNELQDRTLENRLRALPLGLTLPLPE